MRISDWSSDVCSSDLVEHYIFRPIAERTAPWLLRQQIQPRHLRIGAMVTAAIALIIASYGLTWPAIALFLAALAAENISNILAHVTRRPERFRSEEHTSELQSLMRISYAVFCLKK